MRAAIVCVALAAAPALAAPGAEDAAFVEIAASKSACVEGEPVTVRLRVGWDDAWFRGHGVQRFPRPLDVPIQIAAPWTDRLDGAELAPLPDDGRLRSAFALNDRRAEGLRATDVERGGRRYTVVEIERRVVVRTAGAVVLAAPVLTFHAADRFEDDFLRGRVPVAPTAHEVRGAPFRLEVRPLPSAGRPAGLTSVPPIGTFTLSARADRDRAEIGEPFRITVTVRGDGNLDEFGAEVLRTIPGFRVSGHLDRRTARERIVELDVAATAPTEAIPPIVLPCYDTNAGAWRSVATESIPFRVAGATIPPVAPAPVPPSDGGSPWILWTFAGLAGAAGALLLMRRARTRSESDSDPRAALARAAAVAVRNAADATPDVLAEAFVRCLAGRLGVQPAAVVGPGLREKLRAAGVADDVAARCERLVDGLTAARYGGPAPAGAGAEARALVDLLG